MNISLKPSPIIAIWLPGFAFTLFVLFSLNSWDFQKIISGQFVQGGISFWSVVVVIVISFIVGQFLDAVRDILLENLVFKHICGEVKWKFFFEAEEKYLEKLDEWFYTWYEMDANMVVAIVVAAVLDFLRQIHVNFLAWIIMVVATVFFFLDAKELRRDIKQMIDLYYEQIKS
ncbi:MAG: hypothetical protein ACLP05_00560 [Candidatus Kryptoniota bacterium]